MSLNNFKVQITISLLILVVALGYYWAQYRFILTGIDDANIFFVYAKNLSSGHGLVYNIGGERVEGFSSILWTLISATAFYVGNQWPVTPELLLFVLNVIFLAITTSAALNFLRAALPLNDNKWRYELIYALLLLTSPAFLFWTTIALMGSGLWTALITFMTAVVLTPKIRFTWANKVVGALIVLLLLTRPEAYLWVFVFVAILFLRHFQVEGLKKAITSATVPLLAIVITIGSITAFRMNYFGYPFPNTYYAKVSPSIFWNIREGGLYFIRFAMSNPLVTLPVVAVFISLKNSIVDLLQGESNNKPLLFLPIIGAIGLAIPLLIGGDHFAGFRFYQPVYPILLLTLIIWGYEVFPKFDKWNELILFLIGSIILSTPSLFGSNDFAAVRVYQELFTVVILLWGYIVFRVLPNFDNLLEKIGESFKSLTPSKASSGSPIVLISLCAILIWQQVEINKDIDKHQYEFFLAFNGQRTGTFVTEIFNDLDEQPVIGVITAGGVKYAYDHEVIDLLGLNHVQMGHSEGDRKGLKNHAAFNPTVFYELAPDLITPMRIDRSSDYLANPPFFERPFDRDLLRNIYDDPQFLKSYHFAVVSRNDIKEIRSNALAAWFRVDYLNQLKTNGSFQVEEIDYLPNHGQD